MSDAGPGAIVWNAVTASVRGAQHDVTGLPNQDAVKVARSEGQVSALIAAVADGHGGQRYVRSDLGAAMAVEIACQLGAEAVDRLGPSPDPAAVRHLATETFVPELVQRWRDRVTADHQRRPFTAEERSRGGPRLESDPPVAYGATMIVALLGPAWGVLIQIGDGDALVIDANGTVSAPVPTDDRLVGGETTSLCLPDAAADARIAVLAPPLPQLVVLTSDGYGNSFASTEWRQEAGSGLLQAVRAEGLGHVGSRLPRWLAESAQAGGDDVTMALIANDPNVGAEPAAAGPGPSTAAVADAPSSNSSARSDSPTKRRGASASRSAIVAGLVVAAGLGGGVGWISRGSTRSSASTATTTDPPASSSAQTTTTTAISTTTTPGATAPTVPSSAARYWLTTKSGTIVTFVPNPFAPSPAVLLGMSMEPAHPPPVDAAGRKWTPSGSSVQGAKTGGTPTYVRLNKSIASGDVILVGQLLWVVSSDARWLWCIDVSAAQPSAPAPIAVAAKPGH